MDPKIRALLEAEEIQPPASEEALAALDKYVQVTFGMRLPDDYRGFLAASDGYDGTLGGKAYIVLWPAARIQADNEGYESQEWMPGCLMIGSNGGNAVFGLDLRGPDAVAYVETDFVPMGWDNTFGRDASLYDLLRRRVAQQGAYDAGEEDAK